MQSTLRPCGIARSLLRELMIYVDMLGYLCPFPAIASMLLNRQRQRWGDILADTIVIDAS